MPRECSWGRFAVLWARHLEAPYVWSSFTVALFCAFQTFTVMEVILILVIIATNSYSFIHSRTYINLGSSNLRRKCYDYSHFRGG